MGFLDSLGHTFESIGKSAAAPFTLAYDLAKTPFDNKDDDFGSIVNKFAHAGADLADPFVNGQTWTGYSLQKVGEGLNFLYHEGVDQPLSTAVTLASHASFKGDHWGDFLNGDDWAQAYKIAEHQSVFQSIGYAWTNSDDPFADAAAHPNQTPFQYRLGHNPWATGLTTVGDLASMFAADPTAIGGKLAGIYRQRKALGLLLPAERDNLFARMNGDAEKATGLKLWTPKIDAQSRTEGYLSYINEAHPRLGRPLNAHEIYMTTPELQRAGENGKQIAAALQQARNLHPDEVANAQKRILAVAAGDQQQVLRLQREFPDAQSIADGLQNTLKGTTVQLQLQALNEVAQHSPQLFADLQRQIDNLNTTGDIKNFVATWVGKADENRDLQAVASTMHFLPGAHGAAAASSPVGKAVNKVLDKTPLSMYAGDRALTTIHQQRLMDHLSAAHNSIEDAARSRALEARSTVWQKGLNQVPLLAVKTVGLPLSVYTKMPAGVTNALRQTHYIGMANTHQWGDATDQLDSMMKLGGVDDAKRMDILSRAYSAASEPEKRAIINEAERHSVQGLIAGHAARTGRQIDADYIDQLMRKGQADREGSINSIRGRAYAATQADDGTRVDQIMQRDGVPLALPLMSTQLENAIPLFDIHLAKKVLSRDEDVERLRSLGQTWRESARDLNGLQAKLNRGGANLANFLVGHDDIKGAIQHTQDGMDWLLHQGNNILRSWKLGVLFRLGYPMRVVADDHLRIISQLHNIPFYRGNLDEWAGNVGFNQIGRYRQGAREFAATKAERANLINQYGQDALSTADHKAVMNAARVLRKSGNTDPQKVRDAAQATLDRLDPQGLIREWYDRDAEITRLRARANGHRLAVKRWERDAEAAGTEAPRQKIAEAEQKAAEYDAAVAFKQEQQGEDPDSLRKRIKTLNELIDQGPKAFRPAKVKIGEHEIDLGDGTAAPGSLQDSPGFKAAVSSKGTFENQIMVDGEKSVFNALAKGAYRTVGRNEVGHIHAWADVLNHQIRNSPEAMFFVRNPEATASDFARWVKEPEQALLRKRVQHFAADPEDWGGRLQALVDDYVATPGIREKLAKDGYVSEKHLAHEIQNPSERPDVHGQSIDLNSGRHIFQRTMSNAVGHIYKALGEMPTDTLSRNPFFNAIYKKELREAYELRKAAHVREGATDAEARTYTHEDMDNLTEQARKVALTEVKRLLWDVSAHSHAAHTLRFVSPFFAAHQEALTRWWRVASDNPAVVRRFQQVFDVPAQLGLVIDSQDGHVVKPGEGVSQNHMLMLRIPDAFGGANNPLDKWLKKMGGGRYWRVNENGFNLILQNGIANPGTGPLVTVPLNTLSREYANEPDLARAANILNGGFTPTGSTWSQFLPATLQKVVSLKAHDKAWQSQFENNVADNIVTFREQAGRSPRYDELQRLMDKAGSDTNRDFMLMLTSNTLGFTPAKPTSKYAVIQQGWQQIISQGRAQGKDFKWMRDQFVAKYGEMYDALIASGNDNPAGYVGTPAEVAATKKYRGLINKAGDYDPKLARVIVGPDAQFLSGKDAASGLPTTEARWWLQNHSLSDYDSRNFIGSKSVKETFVAGMLSDGWNKYAQIDAGLQVLADQAGLSSYDKSPQLVAARKAALAQIAQNNPIWGQAYADHATGSVPYSQTFNGLKVIAGSKQLASDATRSDVAGIKTYVQLREGVDWLLKQRAAAGGSANPTAKANAPLMQAFAAAVTKLRDYSYFNEYAYLGAIQFDPYLKAGGVVIQ